MILLNASLSAFMQAYGSEEACLAAIYRAKWPRGFVCPYCEHNAGYELNKPRTVECVSCRRQTSITANTLFQDSKLPLVSWFLAIYLVANDKGGVSACRLEKMLGINRKSASLLLRKLRAAMGDRDRNLTLAGYIELDEAFLGGRSNTRSMGKSPVEGKVQVLVMVESENMKAGNLVLQVLSDSKIMTIQGAVRERIDADPPGHTIRTDALGRHHGLRSLGHYVNMTKMSKKELDTKMACLSLAISHLKRFLKGTYHHFCRTHIQSVLDEFCYRWNRRHLNKQITSHLITACVLHNPIPSPKRTPEIPFPQAA